MVCASSSYYLPMEYKFDSKAWELKNKTLSKYWALITWKHHTSWAVQHSTIGKISSGSLLTLIDTKNHFPNSMVTHPLKALNPSVSFCLYFATVIDGNWCNHYIQNESPSCDK